MNIDIKNIQSADMRAAAEKMQKVLQEANKRNREIAKQVNPAIDALNKMTAKALKNSSMADIFESTLNVGIKKTKPSLIKKLVNVLKRII
ncbi:MAG: hypothetical protein PHV68_04810 [Candidatus Gastranaerophilales bacterium]|nr:hypothetical protein [Candidatus Gastranaerophilales bacterium]